MRADGNCRTCMVEIKGERVPGTVVLPLSDGRHGGHDQQRTRDHQSEDVDRAAAVGRSRDLIHAELGARSSGRRRWESASRDSARGRSRSKTCRIPRSTSISTRAFSASAAYAPAARSRSTMSSDTPSAAAHSKIVFDLDDPMGDSTCVACGECVQACPTGALTPAREASRWWRRRRPVDSVCPYCGVGCQLTYHVTDNRILFVQGKDGPANASRLCVKGRYGFDYVQHRHRLTKPLIRKPGVPKHKDFAVDPENWQRGVPRGDVGGSARRRGARSLRQRATRYGKRALAGFGSAKGTNEEAYLFQKLVRTGFGSNNVDHCTRLCHASSVAALMEGINSGAVSNQVRDVANAEVLFVIGANPTMNHPVAATWMKNAVKAGAKLIVADPRRSDLSASRHLLSAVQRRHRRRAAQRAAPRHRRGRPRGRGVRPRPHVGLRRARRERAQVLAGSDGAHLRRRCRRPSARSRACTRRPRAR